MKTRLIAVCILLTGFILSNETFAQRAAGGSSQGAGCVTQPPPESFKRNNGEGTCGENGQIRLFFDVPPSSFPTLVALMYDDGSPVTNIQLPVQGNNEKDNRKYTSYCLFGGNIDPAKKLVAVFHFDGGCQEDTMLYEQ